MAGGAKSKSASQSSKSAKPASKPSTAPTPSPVVASAVADTHTGNVIEKILSGYRKSITVHGRLIDIYLVFLVLLGVYQFAVCMIIGTFPFNAFLGGFISTVGQFVLTVSLRLQTNKENRGEFSTVIPQRALGDYIFASLILHFIVLHFIN